VLGINAALFAVEFAAGWLAHSTALLGDSLDMLGDSLVYAFSLYVLGRSELWRLWAARSKGLVMVLLVVVVLAEAALKLIDGARPTAETMGEIGALALAGNTLCFALLYRHRADDLNMRSTWLCSRNDLVANTAVLAAAAAVGITGTVWPDVIVGVAIAGLFLHTAIVVLRESFLTPVQEPSTST
jgi:Co/Zn/Cd efflux system component